MKQNRLALFFLVAMLVVVTAGVAAQDGLDSTARGFVADTYGVDAASLEVDYKLVTDVPAMGTVTQYKMRYPANDAVYGSFVDRSGNAWTPEEFRAAADAAYLDEYGKLDLQLFQRFEEDSDAFIPVEIWLVVDDSLLSGLRGPDYVGPGLGLNEEPPTRGDLMGDGVTPDAPAERLEDAGVLAAREALETHVESAQASVAARLAARGIEVRAVLGAPILGAVLSRDQALALTDDPDVGRIYADDIVNQDMNSSAQVTHRAPAVWVRGYTGSGAKVALLEDSRAYQNYWLYNYASAKDWGDPNVDDHATRVMGNIGSSHGLHLGIARGAELYSANAGGYSSSQIEDAAYWAAVTTGVDVVNNSWGPSTSTGCQSGMAAYFDWRVVQDRVLVTFAAGNSGNLMSDHAMAFNILSVGSFNDNNTGDWNADSMSSFSAWQEGTGCSPGNGDRQEPDLVAVGAGLRSTTTHPPSIDTSDLAGTSYAAPMVAGEAALLLEIDPNLAGKPEAMRAILMASAVHNIEGDARLSEYDGAGGIDAYSAYLDVLNGRYAQMEIDPSTWTSYDYNFYAAADEPVSCAIAWTSHPTSYTNNPLLTDLDLRLYDPDGHLVASSTSSNNSYEIVRTTTDMAGTWNCRVSKYSSSGDSTWEYLGIGVDRAFQHTYEYPYSVPSGFLPLVQSNSGG